MPARWRSASTENEPGESNARREQAAPGLRHPRRGIDRPLQRDVEHEREVAIYDLLEQNTFAPIGHGGGPYALHLSINGNRLVFDIRLQDGTPVVAHLFSLSPLRRIVKDYYMICDSYYQAIRTATPDKIEAIDMGRRAIHNDGSRILMERLKEKVTVDLDTARRLFTLICVLHWKG